MRNKLISIFMIMLLITAQAALAEIKNPTAVIKTTMGDIHVELFVDAAPNSVANFLGFADGTVASMDLSTQKMVKKRFYDGLTFHRVIKDFMIQGGCPKGDGTGGPGYQFEDEINADALSLNQILLVSDDGQLNPLSGIRDEQGYYRFVLKPLMEQMGIDGAEAFKARKEEVDSRVKALTMKDFYLFLGHTFNESLPSRFPKRGSLAMANSGPNTNGSQFFINMVDTPWLSGKHTVFGVVTKGMDVVDKMGAVAVDERGQPKTPVMILSIRQQ